MARPLRLLLVGPFRRGRTGGVKTHVERLRGAAEDLGFVCKTIDPKSPEILRFPLAVAGVDCVHLHVSNGVVVALLTAVARLLGRRVLLTVHANIADVPSGDRGCFLLAARLGGELLVLNESSTAFLSAHGLRSERVSAFLPPSERERAGKADDTARLRELLADLRKRYRGIFLTYVYSGELDEADIYGVRDLISFFTSQPQWALVVLAGTGGEGLRSQIASDNVLVFEGNVLVPDVACASDGLIRNSRTDGDSLFVQEGVFGGAEVLATDVVSRPRGVLLYRFGDHARLSELLDGTLHGRSEAGGAPATLDIARLYAAT